MIAFSIPINTSASGNTTIVPAKTGEAVCVVGLILVSGGTTNITFTDGASGASLSGQMNFVANTGGVIASLDNNSLKAGEYWMRTTQGNALVLNNSAAIQVGGILRYYYTGA